MKDLCKYCQKIHTDYVFPNLIRIAQDRIMMSIPVCDSHTNSAEQELIEKGFHKNLFPMSLTLTV